jgi:integrase
MATFGDYWTKIAAFGALPKDITPHTLRHSFASVAGDLGYSEPTIGALIGHKGQTITSRYVHTADAKKGISKNLDGPREASGISEEQYKTPKARR